MSFLDPVRKSPKEAWQLRNERNGQLVATTIWPAFDFRTGNRGLLGRTSFEAGHGMMFFTGLIHTFFMKMVIDVAFMARDGRVLKVRPNLGPWRLCGRLFAHACLEMTAGSFATTDLRPGDVVSVAKR